MRPLKHACSSKLFRFSDGMPNNVPQPSDRLVRLWRVIFLSDTRAGKIFDVVLL